MECKRLQVDTPNRVSRRVVYDDNTRIRQGLHGVSRVRRNDCRASRTNDSSFTRYCDLQLTVDDVPDFVIGMGMLVNRGARFNRVIGERHVPGMEETPLPALARLFRIKSICINERHSQVDCIVRTFHLAREEQKSRSASPAVRGPKKPESSKPVPL